MRRGTPRAETSTVTPRDSRRRVTRVGTAYKVYSAIYPALRAVDLLDRLIPFYRGVQMVAWGKKVA